MDRKRCLLCSYQAWLNSRLVCFASCAMVILHHNIGVQFFRMSCLVCLSLIPELWSLFRMGSISLCIPVALNVVDVFCITVSAFLTNIQGSLNNNVTAHLTWSSIVWPQISPSNRQAYWRANQKSKYVVWFDICMCSVLHWWKFITICWRSAKHK